MFNYISNFFDGDVSDDEPIPISEWDEEMKWEVAKRTQYRCSGCETAEFRAPLYLVPALAESESAHGHEDEGEIVPVCEHCLQAADRGEEATEETHLPRPPVGRKGYLIDPDRVEHGHYRAHGEQEVAVIEEGDPTDPDDTDDHYMGQFPRQMVESRYARPRDKLWLGNESRAGAIKATGVEFETLFRHVFINGTTGMGKSVLARNLFLQFLWSGYGACCIDPHEDLINDILRTLPPHRRDDVVLIEPSRTEAKRIVGLNLLEVELEPGDDGYGKAVDEAVQTVVSALRGGGGWGSRMGPICENLSRAMITSERQYTFVDFRRILLSEERRETFAERVADDGYTEISVYTEKIAKMGQDELDSLVRKVNRWVESSLTREIVDHSESSVSFQEILNQDKIILLNTDIGNDDIEEMIATAVLRRLWRAVTNRAEPDRSPYFMLIDEAHEILSPEMEIDEMLTGARKYQFGLILMSQYLGKIDSEEIKEAIREICETFITLRVTGDGRYKLADFYGVSSDQIKKMPKYQCLTTLEIDGDPQGPFRIDLFPEYPWLRTREEAREWVAKPSLQRHGDERDNGERRIADASSGADASESLDLTAERRTAVSQAILDESIIRDNDNGAVTVENTRDRIRAYIDAGDALEHDSQVDALIDAMPTGEEGHIDRWEDENEDIWLQATATGKAGIFATGNSPTSGGLKHRELLKNLYEPFVKLGGRVTLPEQPGGKMPDGLLSLRDTELADVDADALSEQDHQVVLENFIEKRPLLSRIALGRATVTEPSQATGGDFPQESVEHDGIAIEAERSTGNSNPFQTCLNVAQAINDGQRCLLLCRPDTAEKIWKTLTSPPFVSEQGDSESDTQRLYNGGDLVIDGEQILRPAKAQKTVWTSDTETGEYICGDSDGNEYHRFGSVRAVFEDAGAYPATLPNDDEVPDHLTGVKIPFSVERMFVDGEIPDRDDWDIIEVPPGATDPGDLALYADGESIPFDEWEEWHHEHNTTQSETAGNGEISDETATMIDDLLNSSSDDD
jgi:hypothetical protein